MANCVRANRARHCGCRRGHFLRIETWPARTAQRSTAELEKLGKRFARRFYRHHAIAAAHHDQQPRLYGTDDARERAGCLVTAHRS